MADRTARLLGKINRGTETKTEIGNDMYLPNHSGDHRAGIIRGTPEKDSDIVNKKYVDDNDFKRSPLVFNYAGGYESEDPILEVSVAGWDQVFRELGNTIYDEENSRYIMVYSGFTAPYSETNVYVGLATSPDGKTWTKGGNGDGQILTRASEDPYIVLNEGVYYLYFEDKEDVPFRNIRLFTSTDLINWTDMGDVLDKGAGGEWDENDVSSQAVWIEDKTWYMVYEGRGTGQEGAIGLATSNDGLTWTKEATNPVCTGTNLTGEIAWATHMVSDDIIKINDKYYMTFHGFSSGGFRAGMAISSNLTEWTDYLDSWISTEDNTTEDIMVHYDGTEYIFHQYNSGRNEVLRRYPMIKNDYNLGDKDLTTSGITTLKGDVIFEDSGSGLCYGEISMYNNVTADSIATATLTQLTRFDTNGESNNTTPDHTNDHITITKAGRYKISMSVAFSGTGSVIWAGGVYKNNGATQLSNLQTHRKLGASGDVGSATVTGIASLSVNDTIEIWFMQSSGVNKNITVQDCTLSLVQIGG